MVEKLIKEMDKTKLMNKSATISAKYEGSLAEVRYC